MAYTVAFFTDIHDDTEALEKATDFAAAQGVDSIALLGDQSLRPYTQEDLDTFLATIPDEGRLPKTWRVAKAPAAARKAFIAAKNEHERKTVRAMKEILDASGVPYNVMPGNYDGPVHHEVFGNKDMQLQTEQIGDAKVAWFGGACLFPEQINVLHQLGEIHKYKPEELEKLLGKEKPNVVFSHTPPYDTLDLTWSGEHVGNFPLNRYLFFQEAQAVVCGHIHECGPNPNNPEGLAGILSVEGFGGQETIVINPGNLGRYEVLGKFPKSLDATLTVDHGTFALVKFEDNGRPSRVEFYSVQPKSQVRKEGEFKRTVGKVRALDAYNIAA